jgi:hypothetical protein
MIELGGAGTVREQRRQQRHPHEGDNCEDSGHGTVNACS